MQTNRNIDKSAGARDPHGQYLDYWRREFTKQPYYDTKYNWDDFDPAYRYAFDSRAEHPSTKFEEVEDQLASGWEKVKGKSRLAWQDAKQAVRSGWHAVERAMPGDSDRDGR